MKPRQHGITKLGTIVKVPDGRVGTVVFNSLIGVGIKWGRHKPPVEDFEGTTGGTVHEEPREDFPWKPDALLRDPKEFPNEPSRFGMPMICDEDDVEIIKVGSDDD